jgi:hypothetical protein
MQQWLAGKAIAAGVSSAPPEDGKVRLTVNLTGDDATKLDLQDPAIQTELQKLVTDAIGEAES